MAKWWITIAKNVNLVWKDMAGSIEWNKTCNCMLLQIQSELEKKGYRKSNGITLNVQSTDQILCTLSTFYQMPSHPAISFKASSLVPEPFNDTLWVTVQNFVQMQSNTYDMGAIILIWIPPGMNLLDMI